MIMAKNEKEYITLQTKINERNEAKKTERTVVSKAKGARGANCVAHLYI